MSIDHKEHGSIQRVATPSALKSSLPLSHTDTISSWPLIRTPRQSSNRARDGWRLHPLRRRPQSHRLLFSGDTPRSARSHSDRHGLTQSDLYPSTITRYLQRTTQVLFYSAKSRKQYLIDKLLKFVLYSKTSSLEW